jgi:hypothetical protein
VSFSLRGSLLEALSSSLSLLPVLPETHDASRPKEEIKMHEARVIEVRLTVLSVYLLADDSTGVIKTIEFSLLASPQMQVLIFSGLGWSPLVTMKTATNLSIEDVAVHMEHYGLCTMNSDRRS